MSSTLKWICAWHVYVSVVFQSNTKGLSSWWLHWRTLWKSMPGLPNPTTSSWPLRYGKTNMHILRMYYIDNIFFIIQLKINHFMLCFPMTLYFSPHDSLTITLPSPSISEHLGYPSFSSCFYFPSPVCFYLPLFCSHSPSCSTAPSWLTWPWRKVRG